ncbi:hypothetical protein EJ03DRAFT_309284 [Teratosphaeria nubilosa]|uniref:MutL C-terminal dimerisation domain-containing protein n=1 Tax=Teratosphaeria nubilosa TaxID=161662 RepID=A0A6G1LED9_9PEZI|nr:hypothetical protein EJ03DRAFT_309284 [Teratosphaeria nubilosa]
MSRILPLPSDAIAQIHSSKHITSLQHVVCALLENSLDAGSTKVEIRIDFRRGSCTVEDNGFGILPAEFEEHGGLGKLYHSSKCYDKRDLHGSTGTYLASLGALSLLSIASQHSDHSTASTITLHIGRVIERRSKETFSIDSNVTTRHGTQVTMRDLFGNMPVRVKQRALSTDADPKDGKAWHDLKRGVVALLLAWPKPCTVRVRDCNNLSRALNLSAHHQSGAALLTEKHLEQLAGKTMKPDIKDALPIVFQAGLAAAETRNNWVAVRASSGSLSVRGLICLTPAPTKQCQFVIIGVHPCSPASGHNALFDVVNKTFANSSFGAIEHDSHAFDEAEKVRRSSDRRYKNDGYTQKQLRSQKGVDHWPMFILQLKLKEERRHHVLADNIGDVDLKTIVDLLEATMLQWLTVNHFRPRRSGKRRNDEQQGLASAASTPPRPSSAVQQDTDAHNVSGALTPVNSRTGVVLPVRAKSTDDVGHSSKADADRQTAAIKTALSSAGKPLSLARRAIHSSSRSNSSWLPGFLKDWNNPVFTRQDEQRIPIASFDGPGIGLAELGKHSCTEHMMHERFAEAGARVTSKLSKSQLQYVKVIRQVDQKFILCLAPSERSSSDRETLILIDQHAASERVILERLLRELCAPPSTTSPANALTTDAGHQSAIQTIVLDRPSRFQISASESQLFAKHAAHFARWGILYDLSHRTPKITASRVRQPEQEHIITVRALPPGISERCTLAPNILIELLRSEIWSDEEHSWLRTFGSCPKGILDMLNSRACRSAIMFNDVLSKAQCEALLADLRRCAFPFMCAHGRVSMVPVVELGGFEGLVEGGHQLFGSGEDGRQERRGFSDAFTRWRGGDENLD